MRTKNGTYLAATILILAVARFPVLAQDAAERKVPAIAILEVANAGMDPRVDYLGSIVQGILAFDLGRGEDITLVDRRNLDAALKETELSLSGLAQDPGAAAQAGKLIGADWLLSGEYVFLGSDVLLTLSLTETATAKRVVFRDRGADENLVHKLAEQVARRLTGKAASFAESGRSRSLVSLRDESPGSIAIFSPIINAEVFLDDQFVGYTTGDPTLPLVLDKVPGGEHRLRVHLDSSFGDWETLVKVEPDRRATLRDLTRQFNDTLYQLIELGDGELRPAAQKAASDALDPKLGLSKELLFQDRKGVDVKVALDAKPRRERRGRDRIDETLAEAARPERGGAGSQGRSRDRQAQCERRKLL
jgi:TolB-like protein